MKILIWVIVGLVVIGGLSIGLAFVAIKHGSTASSGGMARLRRAGNAGRSDRNHHTPGTIEAKSKVSISARVSARIIGLPYKEGDTVTKGDPNANPPIPPSVLVKLDATDLEAQLHSAEAHYAGQQAQVRVAQANIESQKSQIQSNEAMLEDAKRDLKRQLGLLDSKDVSQSVVDTAQTKVDQLRANLEGAEHNLEGVEQNLQVSQFEPASR